MITSFNHLKFTVKVLQGCQKEYSATLMLIFATIN